MPSKIEQSLPSNQKAEELPVGILQTRMSRRRAVIYAARGTTGGLLASGAGGLLYSSIERENINQKAETLELPNTPTVDEDVFRSRYIAQEEDKKNVHTIRDLSAAAILGFITVFVSERIYSIDSDQHPDSSLPSESQIPHQTS